MQARSSWFDRVVGACLSLLAGAGALYLAVRIIEAVWVDLLIIIGAFTATFCAIATIRSRMRRW